MQYRKLQIEISTPGKRFIRNKPHGEFPRNKNIVCIRQFWFHRRFEMFSKMFR